MIRLENVSKVYQSGETEIKALNNISLEIHKNELTVILGPSGSGKSTMLNILGGIDSPSSGSLVVEGSRLTVGKLPLYRREVVGFVFQFYNLISNLSVYENVAIAEQLTRKNNTQVDALLKQVNLSQRKNNFPDQLSGGEMQRVAIARALSKAPRLLLCDEPTGALDSTTSQTIFQLLSKACNEDTAVVIVTHNDKVAQIADRVIKIKDGEIQESVLNENPLKVSEVNWE